ncbi:MAG: hypothetical protein JRH15_01370 [Deltaproteobacteria bacterium]|nr:hypothetical protein [Deltaproteobacteria bacterium]
MRKLKQQIAELLSRKDVGKALFELKQLPAARIINPLFSFLYAGDDLIKWRAVSAMGAVVSHLAATNMEPARNIMRRLLWNMNDESGGIGWGSPEAMGDIMAESAPLAREYACILVSYIDPNANFVEHEPLQQGVLWGIGRLSHARPEQLSECAHLLNPFLISPIPAHRGLAAWAAGPLKSEDTRHALETLIDDPATLSVYTDRNLETRTIKNLAQTALLQFD